MSGPSGEAARIIRELSLEPHPEGGWFRETFRDSESRDGRSCGTAIYFLLAEGESSAWHRIDAVEIWHHYAGDPLRLSTFREGHVREDMVLGPDIGMDQRPQLVISRQTWQSAKTLGAWTLVGCTVAPGFEFAGFEMAPPDFDAGPSA